MARITLAGIIPARAGFTRESAELLSGHGDHPRSRGVYDITVDQEKSFDGSSPLARGLHLRVAGEPCGARIIPARAGFTRLRDRSPASERDHPRSRGVYLYWASPPFTRKGSSPLARGLPPHAIPPRAHARIIPARAGFTPMTLSFSPRPRDHPRSRGVYSLPSYRISPDPGSSPLARGLRRRRRNIIPRNRIIPARAGFTYFHYHGS